MLLEVNDLHVFYGRIEAIKGISFSVGEGEIVTLIGANGAGKTTTMRTIFRVCKSASHSLVEHCQVANSRCWQSAVL
jgi:branched-chain amino acid transport system ATP-binding protein